MAKKMYKKPQTETLKVQSKDVVLDSFQIPGSNTMAEPGHPAPSRSAAAGHGI